MKGRVVAETRAAVRAKTKGRAKQLLSRLGLVALLLAVGLGSDFRYTSVSAAPASFAALQSELEVQLQAHSAKLSADYSGDRDQLSSGIDQLTRDVMASDDYMKYIVDSYIYRVRSWGAAAKISVNIQYRESAAQTEEVERRVAELLPAIVSAGMTPEQKIRAIHDWIVTHVRYDESLQHYTAYEALEDGTAVCQGYALLAYRMLEDAGIDVRIVEGTVSSGSHVWNMVRLGSEWYHLDVTWDDPVPDRAGQVSNSYYLKSNAQMRVDHQWDASAYPATQNL
ncbi:transglutaminase superfamily protein [Paenibacillus taihuensis]|uniref:Transglutaminase superfamily protein n=1 Tax=Paenibacillus taihuensis TaxID=1156355 RepID=A0A3D9SD17_9BACL|nr:transglutaminase domain-containing protein [Paenibacillus taihuensis]REE92756.1 transglutaminase superfamily protein [Paenibacillus taihuensis]